MSDAPATDGAGRREGPVGRVLRPALLAALVLAALVRLVHPFLVHPLDDLSGDAAALWKSGEDLLHPDLPGSLAAKGYLAWLAFVHAVSAGQRGLVSLLTGLLSVSVLFFWHRACRELLPRTAALAAVLLIALWPPLLAPYGHVMAETLGLPLLGLACWTTLRAWRRTGPWRYAAACASWSALCLTLPQALILAACVLPLLLRQARRAELLLLGAAVFAVFAVPAALHTYANLRIPSPFPLAGPSTILRNCQQRQIDIVVAGRGRIRVDPPSFRHPPFAPLFGFRTHRSKACGTVKVDPENGGADWDAQADRISGLRSRNLAYMDALENACFLLFAPSAPDMVPDASRLLGHPALPWISGGLVLLFLLLAPGARLPSGATLLLAAGYGYAVAMVLQPLAVAEGRHRKLLEPLVLLVLCAAVAGRRDRGSPRWSLRDLLVDGLLRPLLAWGRRLLLREAWGEAGRRLASVRPALPKALLCLTILAIALWLGWIFRSYPGRSGVSDECVYVGLAQSFALDGSLEAGSCFLASLLHNDPPPRDAHLPGYMITLGCWMKAFGTAESRLVLYNLTLLALTLLGMLAFQARVLGRPGAACLAACMLMAVPVLNMYTVMMMAEVTVLASTFLLFWLMFFHEPRRLFLLHGLVLWGCFTACYLVRQNVVVFLPCFLVLAFRRHGWRNALLLCAPGLLYLPVVHHLGQQTWAYPHGVMQHLSAAAGLEAKLRCTWGNFLLNAERMGSCFASSKYNISKTTFYLLALLSLLPMPGLPEKERRLYAATVTAFGLNLLLLFLFYDNYDYRDLRSSIQFLPLFCLILAGRVAFLWERSDLAGKSGLALFTALLLAGLAWYAHLVARRHVADLRTLAKDDRLTQWMSRHADRNFPGNVLLACVHNPWRCTVDFPRATFVISLGWNEFTAANFAAADRKLPFDLVFLGDNRHGGFLRDLGWTLLSSDAWGVVWKRPATAVP